MRDYKFLCFNGRVEYFWIDIGRFSNHTRNFYDRNGMFLEVYSDCPMNKESAVAIPNNLDEMIRIAECLSSGFPFVRVDLYNIEGKITFGEMTFYPWGGEVSFTPDSFDFELGEKFILPKVQK